MSARRHVHVSSNEFDPKDAAGYLALHPAFLGESECTEAIARAEARGFRGAETHYPPSYRNNARQVLDDSALAATLFGRLRGLAPSTLRVAEDAGDPTLFELCGLNPRFRFCRYGAGEAFHIHRDGAFVPAAGERSLLTFMIYLSHPRTFRGGATQFFDHGPNVHQPAQPVRELKPARGTLILFDHALWHAGAPVDEGVKYILRSDLVYRRVRPAAQLLRSTRSRASAARAQPKPAHEGYVWTLAQLADGRIASGGRDCVVRLHDLAAQQTHALRGHQSSVLGLAKSSDGALLSISRDHTMRRWDTDNRTQLAMVSITGGTPISIATQADSIAVGCADHSIRLWSAALEERGRLLGHHGWVWSLANAEGGRLWSASEDGTLCLWDLVAQRLLHAITLGAPLRCLATAPGNTRVAVGDALGRVHVVGVDHAGLARLSTAQAHDAALRALAFTRDGRLLSASEDTTVRVAALADDASWRKFTLVARHADFATALLVRERVHAGRTRVSSAAYDGHILQHEI